MKILDFWVLLRPTEPTDVLYNSIASELFPIYTLLYNTTYLEAWYHVLLLLCQPQSVHDGTFSCKL